MGNVSVYKWADGRKKKQSGVDCTAADKMDIELNFDFFIRAFEEEFDIFFSAFANKNNLFPRTQSETQDDDVAPDLERAERVQLMMEGMEKHTLSKMLEEWFNSLWHGVTKQKNSVCDTVSQTEYIPKAI